MIVFTCCLLHSFLTRWIPPTHETVLGGSSAGKSLLMQALAGRIQDLDVSGDVSLSGIPIDVKDVHNDIGYVPQTYVSHATGRLAKLFA